MSFAQFAAIASDWIGRPLAFWLAVAVCFAWLSGYELNDPVTMLAFLILFLLQSSQNCGMAAIQAKLDDLIAHSEARNALIGIEGREPEEIAAARCADP